MSQSEMEYQNRMLSEPHQDLELGMGASMEARKEIDYEKPENI